MCTYCGRKYRRFMIHGKNICDGDVVGVRTMTTTRAKKQNHQTIIDIQSMARRHPSTLAVTSCECERFISHLHILTTHLCGTMPKTRLMQWVDLLCCTHAVRHCMWCCNCYRGVWNEHVHVKSTLIKSWVHLLIIIKVKAPNININW